MGFRKESRNLSKIKTLMGKNKHNINRIVVSEEFMLLLQDHASEVEIETKKQLLKVEHSFNGIDNSSEDEIETTYLFGVPCFLSDHITSGAVLEMRNGEYFILKNI